MIGSLWGSDSLNSAHGHGDPYVRFCPFVFFFEKVFFEVFFEKEKKPAVFLKLKTKAFFSKQIFITTLKWRNSSLHRQLVSCIYKARRVCVDGSEKIQQLIWGSEEKNE